ncbi:type II toxin-antitoxin system RelE/ParE family toxin [Aquisediminimonas sediminicola]|uniref:type II toxin-antitoxin system RelE/ParE family toxin n=1 Tax=Alteraquisediminimonas sediminicola TaxID=2676787 RepID=UPI001C8F06E0|nr:type II toxin-antitoxin system RelE/ParE family toxin [Aquisediminimonas sediminicola]
MSAYRIQRSAGERLDEIYVYTREIWGEEQAERYIRGLFTRFDDIAARAFPWRPIPADFGVSGYVCHYESHFIYWKILSDGTVGIVTILHERMHQIGRFRDDFS